MVYEDGENWCIKSLDNANRDVCGSVVEKCKSMRNNIVFPPNASSGGNANRVSKKHLELYHLNMKTTHLRYLKMQSLN